MTPPADLIALRLAAASSYSYRKGGFDGGRQLSVSEWMALPEGSRKGYRWAPDPKLVAKLVLAEALFTRSLGQ